MHILEWAFCSGNTNSVDSLMVVWVNYMANGIKLTMVELLPLRIVISNT